MPFKEHKPFDQAICRHPAHNPPTMIVLPPGIHTWECPSCRRSVQFVVNAATCSA